MNTTVSIDAALLPQSSYWPDIIGQIDRDTLVIEDLFAKHIEMFQPLVDQEALSLATWILDTIESAPSVQIGFVCVNILLNRSPYTELTLFELARKLGTTKKTLSLFLVTQRDKIHLKPAGIAKSKLARANLKRSQKFYNENRRHGKPGPRDRDRIGNYRYVASQIAEGHAKAAGSRDKKACSEVRDR